MQIFNHLKKGKNCLSISWNKSEKKAKLKTSEVLASLTFLRDSETVSSFMLQVCTMTAFKTTSELSVRF